MDISSKRVAVATHELVYGAPQALKDYLLAGSISRLLFIAHPLVDSDTAPSYFEYFQGGKKERTAKNPGVTGHILFRYIYQMGLTFFWVITSPTKFDIFFGVDPLNAFSGLFLKFLGKTKKTVYYTIDFVPKRFKNNFLNTIYHWIDRLCVAFSDETWNVSPRIQEGRENYFQMKGKLYCRQKVVPIGVWFDKVKRVPFDFVKKHQILFLGNLLEKQGVQLVLSVIPDLVKDIPDFQFLIVGDGDYRLTLEAQVRQLDVQKYVTFKGWIKDRNELDRIMADSAIAMALYDREKDNFTYYADPTKLKDYLSAGLPILLTDVPYNAREIEEKKCGVIVGYDKDMLKKAIVTLLGDESQLKEFRSNAVSYASTFDWKRIFDGALCTLN